LDKLQERTALKRIGEVAYNKLNEKMTIIKYNNCKDVIVQFENGFSTNAQYGNFKRGTIKSKDDALDRIGEISYSNIGREEMIIIKYITARKVVIKFKSGYITTNSYKNFITGNIRNPYYKSIYGVGFLGEGKYKTHTNNKTTKCYKTWAHMMDRCYNMNSYEKKHTYKDCTVCEEWHNFQNFAKWYDENFYEINDEVMCIDKDILMKGNKIYSPETCVFVPQHINNLFVKDNAKRGEYYIGVFRTKNSSSYISQCNNNGVGVAYLGSYDTPEEAYDVYKTHKEILIKKIADKYQKYIPNKLYEAMYKYEVDITD